MCGYESWTIKKAECRRIDAFEVWCWRRLLRVPWTTRRSKQSILKEISPEYSLEGLMLKLKLQQFGHLMWRTDSLEKTLMLGKIEGRRRRRWQRMRQLDGITDSMDMSLVNWSWWWTGRPGVLRFMGSQRVGHDWATKMNCVSALVLDLSYILLLHLYYFYLKGKSLFLFFQLKQSLVFFHIFSDSLHFFLAVWASMWYTLPSA